MKKFLQTTVRLLYGTTILGHGNPSADVTTLLPDSSTRTRNAVWKDL